MVKKKQIFKFLFFFLCSKLIILLLVLITKSNIFQIFQIENLGNSDLEWNDLHYKRADIKNDPHYTRQKSVVLINTGTLNSDSFRLQLAHILFTIKKFNPKAIGIDHTFSNSFRIGTEELISEVNNNPLIVVADDEESKKNHQYITFKIKKGNVDFPDLYTIRRYYSDTSTFGFQLAKMAFSKKIQTGLFSQKEFTIHYSTQDGGISESAGRGINFKSIDGKRLLQCQDSLTYYKGIMKNKIVVIGHLGTIENDVEDRHRVPIDTVNIMLRDRTMYGSVIHANAIENIIHPSSCFSEMSDLQNTILQETLFILFLLLLFCEFGKLVNLLILVVFSILYLIFVLKIMEYNIYIKVSNTLLYLLFIEEFYEVLQPFYVKLSKKLKMRKQDEKSIKRS